MGKDTALILGSRGAMVETRITITAGSATVHGVLFDSPCGKAIADALPFDVVPHEWGDEFYFEIPVAMPLDDTATTRVAIGDIGYWPPGNALAIFFGPTPMSTGPDPVPASEVNSVGRIDDDATVLRTARGTGRIRIEKR